MLILFSMSLLLLYIKLWPRKLKLWTWSIILVIRRILTQIKWGVLNLIIFNVFSVDTSRPYFFESWGNAQYTYKGICMFFFNLNMIEPKMLLILIMLVTIIYDNGQFRYYGNFVAAVLVISVSYWALLLSCSKYLIVCNIWHACVLIRFFYIIMNSP